MARLFVAVWPPADVVGQLRALDRPVLPGVRWTTEDQWHMTLRFLGEADAGEAAGAVAELRHPVVAASLATAGRRLGPSAYVLDVSGLEALAAAARDVMKGVGALGPGSAERPFHGHLTIARLGRRARPPRRLVVAGAQWPVEEVTLVESHLHPRGARYEVVSRVSLG